METSKFRKLYLLINIPIIVLFSIILITPLSIIDRVADVYYVGIVTRIIMGIWFIFNGLWNGCTDYYSFLKNNRFQKNTKTPRWIWLLLFILGVGCIITAFMGYGFNGVKKPL
ncbi:hypothetical protein [Clostridium folliculivorans]|uniref:Uncharacterized protein n=1 Tax=Clostridium folliculivorans TaxID=2886038 RepID=A0A9W6DAJ6_9CLOT|nr:hypothetical protein [Clostridium folliculivorans]GKU25036.1 hypothetical protein CFOLD11_18620 [Clostridium folliculivorans]GKU31134.1 hypothetical protein CFB3_32410 [Clostridium folliculivorans]